MRHAPGRSGAPSFGEVLASLFAGHFGYALSTVALNWFAFSASGSTAIVGLVWTARLIPLAVAGPMTGTLADRLGMARVLAVASLLAAAASSPLVIVASPSVAMAIGMSAVLGFADAARMVGGPKLAFELAGRAGAGRAIAITSFIAGAATVAGGAAGALLLQDFSRWAGAAVVLRYVAAAIPLARAGATARTLGPSVSFGRELLEGIGLIRKSHLVATLVLVAFVAEIFGFSAAVLDPEFGARVWLIGPLAVGVTSATRSLGRMVGSLLLAWRPRARGLGASLAAAVAVFGLALVSNAVAPAFIVALPVIGLAGVCSALVDALEQTAIQAGVPESAGGRAAGLWVLSVGLGPLGFLLIGLLAEAIGPRAALLVNGLVLATFGLAMFTPAAQRVLRHTSGEVSASVPAIAAALDGSPARGRQKPEGQA